jgi:pyrroloquinoline quinone (PQQ) biosynthesis protein C
MEVFMRMHLKQHTEPIFDRLADYRARLVEHPLLVEARAGRLPEPLLHEFAFHQLGDSILWIPMLAQMHDHARSPRLRRALADNIGHEAGLHATSHVTLALAMIKSLGIESLRAFPTDVVTQTIELWLHEELEEPAVAGWLLVAESLVPILFGALLPCFERLGADTRYFAEHVAVDADEHATWMAEAVEEIVEASGSEPILDGMADAWAETCLVPDRLWRLRCASH